MADIAQGARKRNSVAPNFLDRGNATLSAEIRISRKLNNFGWNFFFAAEKFRLSKGRAT
jgi:hypothetical protein